MVDKFLPKVDLSLPGHNYLGPGNPIENGSPVDSDDEIARKHDEDYENATSSEDVRAADRKAIVGFTKNLIKTRHWHNAVGASGLTAKYAVETVTGVVYPNNPDDSDEENAGKESKTPRKKPVDRKLDLSMPGHSYLGPGNPIQNGSPVDSDDEIARKHDEDYENAKTSRDVRAADRTAIVDFTKNLVKTGNWHNAVGASGLTAKYAVETVTGVIYPNTDNTEAESTNSGSVSRGKSDN